MNRDRIVKHRYENSAELDKKVLTLERVHVNFRHRSNEIHCEESGKSMNNYYIYTHTHKYIYIQSNPVITTSVYTIPRL
jgi:hypothetical protein